MKLERHQRTHLKGAEKVMIVCSTCGDTCTRNTYMNHMKLHPEIQNFVENRKNQCQYCFELFQSIEEREEHVIEEHKSKLEWKMNEERQKLEDLRFMADLVKENSRPPAIQYILGRLGINIRLSCTLCGLILSTNQKRMRHHRRVHQRTVCRRGARIVAPDSLHEG